MRNIVDTPAPDPRAPTPVNGPRKAEVDAIVETVIYLYTESRRLTKGLARRFGLTGPQLTVLKLLQHVGDLSLSSLSSRIRAQNSTVTGIIDRMEREALVRRDRSERDRRVVLIRLTDEGRRLAESIEVEPMEIFRRALGTLPREDVLDLFRILGQVQDSVRREIARRAQGDASGGAADDDADS